MECVPVVSKTPRNAEDRRRGGVGRAGLEAYITTKMKAFHDDHLHHLFFSRSHRKPHPNSLLRVVVAVQPLSLEVGRNNMGYYKYEDETEDCAGVGRAWGERVFTCVYVCER